MINFIYHHPYLLSTIALHIILGIFIMLFEMRRAKRVPDNFDEKES